MPRSLKTLPPNKAVGSSQVRTAPAFNSAALTRWLAAFSDGLFRRASLTSRLMNSVESATELVSCIDSAAWSAIGAIAQRHSIVTKEIFIHGNQISPRGEGTAQTLAGTYSGSQYGCMKRIRSEACSSG